MKSWFKSGAPWIWLNAGAVAICMIMVVGLLSLIAVRGFAHFWPADVAQVEVIDLDGNRTEILGEVVRSQTIPAAVAKDAGYLVPEGVEMVTRFLFKQGNRDQTGRDFAWYTEFGMGEFKYPENVWAIERREWGNFYGYPVSLTRDGIVLSVNDSDFWDAVQASVARSIELHDDIKRIERGQIGRINRGIEQLRLDRRSLDLREVEGAEREQAEARIAAEAERLDADYEVLRAELDLLYESTRRDSLRMRM
ncbi:MAG: phosphate ABC transporter, permease protein PstA, partial [Pseudomonadaceae bacterium]